MGRDRSLGLVNGRSPHLAEPPDSNIEHEDRRRRRRHDLAQEGGDIFVLPCAAQRLMNGAIRCVVVASDAKLSRLEEVEGDAEVEPRLPVVTILVPAVHPALK